MSYGKDVKRLLLSLKNRIVRRSGPGRAIEVWQDDAFLVSFPKSGNTWVRYMLACAISKRPEGVALEDMEILVPNIYSTPIRYLQKVPTPRILKSHESFDPRYGRVIYLVRHPADVAVSYYHHCLRMGFIPRGTDLNQFVRSQVVQGGPYGTWAKHVDSWLDQRHRDERFLLVRYEDLVRNPKRGLLSILQHLGIDLIEDDVESIVAASTVGTLRSRESQERARWKEVRSKHLEVPFFRKGISGEGINLLGPQTVAFMRDSWASQIARVGYDDLANTRI